MEEVISQIKFDQKGLIPAIVQDFETGEVLMMAYMNKESFKKTIKTGKATFWSRSRKELWIKGESSGNYQQVKEIKVDCDQDTLLLLVKPAGPACHTGKVSCFYRSLDEGRIVEQDLDEMSDEKGFFRKAVVLKELSKVIMDRKANPLADSYTSYLFREGIDKICKKLGEEAAEVIIGAKNGVDSEIIFETADFLYHLLVLFSYYNLPLESVFDELTSRKK